MTTGNTTMSHTTQTPPAARKVSIFKDPFVTTGIAGALLAGAIIVGLNLRKAETAAPTQPLVSVQADCDPVTGPYLHVTWTGFPTTSGAPTLTITDRGGPHRYALPTGPTDADGIWDVAAPGPVTVTVAAPGATPVVETATVPGCKQT
jgi:hypothetical protein